MKIGILGTGVVGQTLGTKLVQLGHDVRLGSRTAGNAKGQAWARVTGSRASCGTFAEAAGFGDLAFNCTAGNGSLEAVGAAGPGLDGKVLIDVANPLDFSRGMPPTMTICNTDSLGEQIQRARPAAKVVKALNTVNCSVMVNPGMVPGEHDLFICGNEAGAKATVTDLLRSFGWRTIHDMGDITAARGTEMFLPFWIRMMGVLGTATFNVHVVR